ncbi:MAG: hypothetical protein EA356_14150 [Geminicoccaceae bacterium]|nr:MAG: hypothetical protein EA356_14150 [Geminicoccaceae bacterium]
MTKSPDYDRPLVAGWRLGPMTGRPILYWYRGEDVAAPQPVRPVSTPLQALIATHARVRALASTPSPRHG